MRNRRWATAVSAGALMAMAAVACDNDGGDTAGDAADRPLVIATTSILGDLVENVVGDDADVEVLIGRGTDPHEFEASARQGARLRDADLVVANGLGLETSITALLDDVAAEGVEVLEVAEEVDPLPFSQHAEDEHAEDEHAEDEHAHGELDPHFWTDPLRMAEAAGVLASALDGLEPGLDWATRAEVYADELRALHDEITDLVARIPEGRRKLVTNHEVFGYFAARYGFEVIGVVIPGGTTLREASPQALAELADTLEVEGVPAVFAETTQPGALVETLRREAGIKAEAVELFTESLGEPGGPADTYVDMMRENARRIVEALA